MTIEQELKFVADFVVSFTVEELMKFRKVSNSRGETIAQTVRYCMNAKCEELLKSLEDTAGTSERTSKQDVSNQTS